MTRQADNLIPDGFADKWERMTSVSSQRLFDKRKNIMAAVGTRPYKGLPVSEAELLSRYTQVRRDPKALMEILQENATFKSDGRVLVKKALVEAMVKMEAKVRTEGTR